MSTVVSSMTKEQIKGMTRYALSQAPPERPAAACEHHDPTLCVCVFVNTDSRL